MNTKKEYETSKFYLRLRTLRKARGLTLKEMSNQVGVPESTYREWEYGRSIQGEAAYPKISAALEIPLGELITGQKANRHSLMKQMNELEARFRNLKIELLSFL